MQTTIIKSIANLLAWRFIGVVAFNRIKVVNRDNLSVSGPILYVATHRNGALDAAAYKVAVKNIVPIVSAQLQRSAIGRFLFQGIPVARAKDRERGIQADNALAMTSSLEVLKNNGQLFVMPEGTSTLGHTHLPFHRGAARIAHAAIEAGVKLTIIPLAVHYEDPTVWQSRVEVLVGNPVQPNANADIATLHSIITHGLESVGANFGSANDQRSAEALAYAATLGTETSYAKSLKYFEQLKSDETTRMMQRMESVVQREKLCTHQRVPLIPLHSWMFYALYWLILIPFVVSFSLLNAPVLVAGYLASRKLPDAPNVMAFWRMMVGLPAALIWVLLISLMLVLFAGSTGMLIYWVATIVGIKSWYRFRKLSVALCNGLLHGHVKKELMQMHRELNKGTPHD